MTNTANNATKSAKKPIYRKQLPGGVSAAVFLNEREGKTYRSVNLQRSYRDRKGDWQRHSVFLDHSDLPFAIEALKGTLDYLNGTLTEFYTANNNAQEDTTSVPSDESAVESEAHA